jgi:hypothetical protein
MATVVTKTNEDLAIPYSIKNKYYLHMKTARRIALYTLCLLLTLSWVSPSVSNIIKISSEKKNADKKEAVPEGKSEMEEKKLK